MLRKTKFTRHFETFSTFFSLKLNCWNFLWLSFQKNLFSLQFIHVKMVKSESNGKVSGNSRTGSVNTRTGSLKSFEQGKFNYEQCYHQCYFWKAQLATLIVIFFISYTIGCDFSNKCQVIIEVLCFSLDPFLWYYDHISNWYSSTSFTQSFSISVVIGLSLSNI